MDENPSVEVPAGGREEQVRVRVQAGESQNHLVHFAVAVAAHSDYLFGERIQNRGDALGIPAIRERIPGTVVQVVAAEQKNVERGKRREGGVQTVRAPVYVGKNKYFHSEEQYTAINRGCTSHARRQLVLVLNTPPQPSQARLCRQNAPARRPLSNAFQSS